MATYRVEVGYQHGVKPGNIVGAIANEGGIDSKFIGRIEIYDDYSLLDMPADLLPGDIDALQALRVAGQALRLHRDGEAAPPAPAAKPPRAAKPERAERPAPPLSERDDDDEPMFEDAPKRKKKDKADGGAKPLPLRAYRVEVGAQDGVNAGNLVGAISNESGLESRFIGRIEILDDHAYIEMPEGMPDDIFKHLRKVWVGGKQLKMSLADAMPPMSGKHTPPKKPAPGKGKR
jgi:ATP-dependent RNA helicase DeaD